MSPLAQASSSAPLRIAVSHRVRADLVGRAYRLTFPAQPATTACIRQTAGSRWDPKRRAWLMPAGDANRVRATLGRIDQALSEEPGPAKARDPDLDDEPKVLVRDGTTSVGQRIQTPQGWGVIASLGPAFLGGERLRRNGRPDLVGVALRWAYCRLADQEAA